MEKIKELIKNETIKLTDIEDYLENIGYTVVKQSYLDQLEEMYRNHRG